MSSTHEEFVWSPEMDLMFVSGDFFERLVHREKEYLFKYFDTKLQRQFVRYFLLFRSPRNFTDHTGLRVQPLWLRKLRKKLSLLEIAHTTAKKAFDTETVALLEQGKYRAKKHAREKLPPESFAADDWVDLR